MPSQFQQSRWPPRRWCSAIALVFAAQVGLVFWLGERGPIRSRPPGPTPALWLAGGIPAELLALQDPTLFALPHRQGFSGPAWLKGPAIPNPPSGWSEEPRPLPLCVTQLGAFVVQQAGTNLFTPRELPLAPEPEASLPDSPPLPLSLEQSRLQIEGPLAEYRLLTKPDLPSWQYNGILTNTGVQVVVDAEGRPRAWTLLFGSGYPRADDHALAQARTARFEIPDGPGHEGFSASTAATWLIRGLLVFEWHTVPLPPTNAPPIK